ncbi:hypothetical protein D9M73_247330 [compost metagenome]
MQYGAQRLGKLAVAHRFGCARIIGTAGLVAMQKKINQGDLIVDMNPRHPLPAVADRPSQAQFERQ